MTIKNNSGWTIEVKGAIEKVTNKAIESLKEYATDIYWNDSTCKHWVFDFKLDQVWFENAEVDCNNLKMTVYVY